MGRLRIDQSIPNMDDIAKSWDEENWVLKGGAWRPSKCEAVSKVSTVIVVMVVVMTAVKNDGNELW